MNFQNRPDMQPRPPRQPIFNSPPVVMWMIGLFVAIHVARYVLPGGFVNWALINTTFIPVLLTEGFPSHLPASVLSLFTYQLLHGDFMHLAFNSVWMLVFGTIVARRLEMRSFIVFFFACGAIGAIVHYILGPGSPVPVVGASGAISGLMGAVGRFALFPPYGGWQLAMQGSSYGVVPLNDRRLQAFVGVWIAINLVFGLGAGFAGGGMVAWDIHIAGLIAGVLLFPRFDAWRRPPGGPGGGERRDSSHLRRVK